MKEELSLILKYLNAKECVFKGQIMEYIESPYIALRYRNSKNCYVGYDIQQIILWDMTETYEVIHIIFGVPVREIKLRLSAFGKYALDEIYYAMTTISNES